MTIDANSIKQIRKELENLLTAYGDATNMKFDLGNISYNAGGFKLSLQGNVKGSVIQGTDKLFVGQEGTHKTLGPCKVSGYNSRAHKFPLVIETLSGEKYKVPVSAFIPKNS